MTVWRLSTEHLQHVNSLFHCRALSRMQHCSPFVIDADGFQEQCCSDMATVILVLVCVQTGKLGAQRKNTMETPRKILGFKLHVCCSRDMRSTAFQDPKWPFAPGKSKDDFTSAALLSLVSIWLFELYVTVFKDFCKNLNNCSSLCKWLIAFLIIFCSFIY